VAQNLPSIHHACGAKTLKMTNGFVPQGINMENNCVTSIIAISDEDLIEKIKCGDKPAYKMIVERYLTKLWRLGMSVLRNETDAEDAVQDVLLSIWQNKETLKSEKEGGAKFSTWIYRVMLNRCIDIKRRKKPQTGTEIIDEVTCDNNPSAESLLVDTQNSANLLSHLMEIPEKQRLAIILFYFEELSVKEISDKLSTTEQAVRALLKRGRSTLKERFENESPDDDIRNIQGSP
jgi:RNA polymerase sigma-70 factor (ECF subfamily)